MRTPDKMNLLSPTHYVGIEIPFFKFQEKAGITEYQKRVAKFAISGSIYVLYNINKNNSKIIQSKKVCNEIQILCVDVTYKSMPPQTITKVAEIVQRGIPYQLIIIYKYLDEYMVVVPTYHDGKRKDISVIDNVDFTKWCDMVALKNAFEQFETIISEKTTVSEIVETFIKQNNNLFYNQSNVYWYYDQLYNNDKVDREYVFTKLVEYINEEDFYYLLLKDYESLNIASITQESFFESDYTVDMLIDDNESRNDVYWLGEQILKIVNNNSRYIEDCSEDDKMEIEYYLSHYQRNDIRDDWNNYVANNLYEMV